MFWQCLRSKQTKNHVYKLDSWWLFEYPTFWHVVWGLRFEWPLYNCLNANYVDWRFLMTPFHFRKIWAKLWFYVQRNGQFNDCRILRHQLSTMNYSWDVFYVCKRMERVLLRCKFWIPNPHDCDAWNQCRHNKLLTVAFWWIFHYNYKFISKSLKPKFHQ